jgi:(p)ppGpp synthase/HD superfamily hydrolase
MTNDKKVIAAILHDVVEDTDIIIDEIEEKFSKLVI